MITPTLSNTSYTADNYKEHIVSEYIHGVIRQGSGSSIINTSVPAECIVQNSVTIRENVCVNQFHVGGAISRQVEIRLLNKDEQGNDYFWSLSGGELFLSYTYKLDDADNATAAVPLGTFVIDMQSIKRTKTYTEFVGYDYLIKADKVITESEYQVFDARTAANRTLAALVEYACTKSGLTLSDTNNIFANHANNGANPFSGISGGKSEGYSLKRAYNAQSTWRDVLSSAAALAGCALKMARTAFIKLLVPVSFYTSISNSTQISGSIGRDQPGNPGITAVSVNQATFISKVGRQYTSSLHFSYRSSNWYLSPDFENTVVLSEYGVSYTGTPNEYDAIMVTPPVIRTPVYTIDAENAIKREVAETANVIYSVSYSNAAYEPGSAETLSQYLSLDLGDNILLPEAMGSTTMTIIQNATKRTSTSSTSKGTGIRADAGTNGDIGALQLFNIDISWFGDPCIEAGDFITSAQTWINPGNDSVDINFYVMENVWKPHANCTIRSFAGSENSIYSSTSYNYGGSTGGGNSGSSELAVEVAQINSALAGTRFVQTTSTAYEQMQTHGSTTYYVLTDTNELYYGDNAVGGGGSIDPEVLEQIVEEEVVTAMALYEEGGGHIGGDLDQGFISTLREINHNLGFKIWLGTRAEYAAIAQPQDNVMYIRTDEDSGWQTLSISGTGFTASTPTPQYRRIGNRVFVKGQILVDTDSIEDITTVFAHLPSGFRPATTLYRLIPGEGDRQARLYVTTSGTINLNYFKTYAGVTVTGEHWIQIDCEFLTD